MPLTPEVQSSLAVGRRRARIAAALLAAATIVDAAQAVSYWMQKRLLDRIAAHIPDPHEVYEANDLRVRALAVVALVLLAATGIAFLSWLHRAVRNAREVNPEFLGTTPGAAVGAFFIPFVNFVRPVMVIRALDRAVEPSELPLP